MRLPTEGFEPLSSDVDWCEPNYVISPYITEFWNTVNHLAYCFIGKCLLTHSYMTAETLRLPRTVYSQSNVIREERIILTLDNFSIISSLIAKTWLL